MNKFTFIQEPALHLHHILPEILTGVRRIITVYRNDEGKPVGHYSEKETAYVVKEMDLFPKAAMVNKFIQEKHPHEWISIQNLPFELEIRRRNPVVDIFSEYQNSILLLRLPEINNRNMVLVFIFLNEDQSNFGITHSNNKLTTDNKGVIAFIMHNVLHAELKSLRENQSTLKEFNSHINDLYKRIEGLKKDKINAEEKYGNSLVKLFQQFFEKHSLVTGKTYSFTENAITAIREYEGDLGLVDSIVSNAIGFLDNLNFDKESDIEVTDLHLKLDDVSFSRAQYVPDASDEFYGKTIAMLNRLENAALVVKGHGMKLTGTNVGQAFPEPVSAPAITDSLKNHHNKIVDLAKMYPTHWTTIRREFKPLLNVLER